MVNFLLGDQPSTYNTIIGRPTLNALRAVVSTYQLAMKFPAGDLVGKVRGDQAESWQYYAMSTKFVEKHKVKHHLSFGGCRGPTQPKQHLPHIRRTGPAGEGKREERRSRRGAGIHQTRRPAPRAHGPNWIPAASGTSSSVPLKNTEMYSPGSIKTYPKSIPQLSSTGSTSILHTSLLSRNAEGSTLNYTQ